MLRELSWGKEDSVVELLIPFFSPVRVVLLWKWVSLVVTPALRTMDLVECGWGE